MNRNDYKDGVYFLEVTTAHTSLSLKGIQINTDSVLGLLTITDQDGTAHNGLVAKAVDSFGLNLTGVTLKSLTKIFAPEGSIITAVTFASGNGIGIITRNR